MKPLFYEGELYNDDRMFTQIVAKCTDFETDELITTTIFHEEAPNNHKWCVITFKNIKRYMACRVDNFDTKIEATEYLEEIDPQTPLISLEGSSPVNPMTFEKYSKWKHDNNFHDYDYKKMFIPGSENPQETITRFKRMANS